MLLKKVVDIQCILNLKGKVETQHFASHTHQLKVLVRNQTVPGLVEFSKAIKKSGCKSTLFSPLSTLPDRGRSGYAKDSEKLVANSLSCCT